jgi:hypothetical protein
MFETLEPREQPASRWLAFLMYIVYGFCGLVFFVLGTLRNGFSRPTALVISAAMFLLSVTWLIVTLRSKASLTSRQVGMRNIMLLVLLMAHDLFR